MKSIFVKKETDIKNRTDGSITVEVKPKQNEQIDSISNVVVSEDCEDQMIRTEQYIVLQYEEILRTIPSNAQRQPDKELQKTHTEWRWRFFDLKGRKLIEISQKKPNHERMYVDTSGNWVAYNLRGNWDQFLEKSIYVYIE